VLQGSARYWVRAGAEGIVIAGRRRDKLDNTLSELTALNKSLNGATKILAVSTDVTKESDTDHLFDEVKRFFGRPADVVLANAGRLTDTKAPHTETIRNWWGVYEVNVLGTHNTAMSFIKSQPDPEKPVGTFVSVSTGLVAFLFPGTSAYATSKVAAQRYIEQLNIGK
jgi:NAD(P)-dependent dehydrogenase (short-subunit alcohol dehydrogenase family)